MNYMNSRCFLVFLIVLAFLALSGASAVVGQVPPATYVNAPLGEIKRFPGDGAGAFKTGKYRDLFAEQGHAPAETKAKIEKAEEVTKGEDGPVRYEVAITTEVVLTANGKIVLLREALNVLAAADGMFPNGIADVINKK